MSQINYKQLTAGNYNLAADLNYKYVVNDEIRLICDSTLGVINIQLPEISELAGFLNLKIFIIDEAGTAATNAINIFSGGADTINNGASLAVSTNGAELSIYIASKTAWAASLQVGSPPAASAAIADLSGNIYVAINGNDLTGIRGRIDKPFATINAAIAAATTDNDLICISAGIYTPTELLVDLTVGLFRLNIFAPAGVVINLLAGFLFDDVAGGFVVNMTGAARINVFSGVVGGIVNCNSFSIFNLEYDEDTTSSSNTFVCSVGQINIRANKSTNSLNLIALVSGTGIINANIAIINNTNTERLGAFMFDSCTDGTSVINFKQLTSNPDDTAGAITLSGCDGSKVFVVGEIIIPEGFVYTNLASAILLFNGGYIDFKGRINILSTAVWAVKTYGNSGFPSVSPNQAFIEANISSVTNTRSLISVNNSSSFVTVNNSVIQANCSRDAIEVGFVTLGTDDNDGNLYVYNTQIINIFDIGGLIATTVVGIDGGVLQMSDVIIDNKNSNVAATSIQGLSGAQNIRILTGGVSANLDKDANITNTIVGTSFVFDPTITINNFN